jgi:DNA polymerase I
MTAETEVLTTSGLRAVPDLKPGVGVYALDTTTGIVRQQRLARITSADYQGLMIGIESNRANLQVGLDQRIPYRTDAINHVRFQTASDLGERYQYEFVSEWRMLPGHRVATVDVTDLVDDYEICVEYEGHGHSFRAALPDGCEPCRRNSHVGYYFDAETFKRHQPALESIGDRLTIHAGPNHHRRPYTFDGDEFIELIGWFVTEGSVYRPPGSETAILQIAQKSQAHRESIAELLETMGLQAEHTDNGFRVGSRLFGDLFESLCGRGSAEKRLPGFVWSLCREQQELLLNVLMDGDGNEYGTYYTTSDRLLSDFCRLCLEVGVTPKFRRRSGCHEIYVRRRTDRMKPSVHVSRINHDGPLYRLFVTNDPVVLAGRNGKLQWVGTSGVA